MGKKTSFQVYLPSLKSLIHNLNYHASQVGNFQENVFLLDSLSFFVEYDMLMFEYLSITSCLHIISQWHTVLTTFAIIRYDQFGDVYYIYINALFVQRQTALLQLDFKVSRTQTKMKKIKHVHILNMLLKPKGFDFSEVSF